MTSKSKRRFRWLAGSVGLLVTLALGPVAHAFEPHCHPQTICTTGIGGCRRAPSSLPDVDELQRIPGDGYVLGNRCGIDSNLRLCGKYFGKDVCPDGGTCECGPGHPPCETGTGPVLEAASPPNAVAAPAVAEYEGVSDYEKGLRAITPASETTVIRDHLARFRSSLPPALAELWERLAALDSIHLRATVEVWQAEGLVLPGEQSTGRATYEYWEEGDRYRVSADVPASLGMSRITDVASDGVLRQMLLDGMQTITVSRQDTRMVPVAVRNPLSLALGFLLPSYESCPHCELRLADLRAVRPVRGRSGALRFPGEVVHEVELSARPGERGEIAAIVSREPGGRLLRRVLLADYQAVPGVSWRFPRTVRVEQTAYEGEDESPVVVLGYRIERLSVNSPLDRSVFQIPWQRAERVWDDERQAFVKRPGGTLEPREKLHN